MLSQSTLKSALQDLMTNQKGTDKPSAAANWADAFDAYGAGVTNINGDGPLAPPNKLGFQAALSFSGTTSAQQAQEFATAWKAYFTALVFTPGTPGTINGGPCPNLGGNTIFGIIASSTVTVINEIPLIAALQGHFDSFSGTDPEAAADALASIFHSHTITLANLTVLTSGTDTTPPPAGPLPITNTCGVF